MRRARFPLDPGATQAANKALDGETDGQPLGPEAPAHLRKKWLDAYATAGGAVEDVGPQSSLKRPVDACPPRCIELEYSRADGAPVPRANYVVKSSTGEDLYRGRLDDDGYAIIREVPEQHITFTYYFHKDPQPYIAVKTPRAAPDEASTRSVLESVIDWIWGTLQGDFNEDATTSQIVVNMLLGLIPFVDTALDIRDIIAGIKHLITFYLEDEATQRQHPDVLGLSHEVWLWVNLFIIALGSIPELGSVIKGVLRVLLNYLQSLGTTVAHLEPKQIRRLWELVVKTMNDYGFGHANEWLVALPGKLDGWMAYAATKIRAALDAVQSTVKETEAIFNGWLARTLLSRADIDAVLTKLKAFKRALDQVYARLDAMKTKVGAWIREQVTNFLPGSHNFEKPGMASPHEGSHVNTRVQERVPAPPLDLPPLHVNNAIKAHWKEWPEAVRKRYMAAQAAVTNSSALVRKMSAEELAAIQRSRRGAVDIDDVFPAGKEGNKAFALDRTYDFKDPGRNLGPGYEQQLAVRLQSGLREYLLQHMVPDRLPGGLPADLKDLPRFKLEQDGFTILIPKSIWSTFVKYVD